MKCCAKCNSTDRDKYGNCRVCKRIRNRRYKRADSEDRRKEYAQLKQQIFNHYGNQCTRCSFTDPRALQIDHINGGGLAERRSKGSNGISRLKRVLQNPAQYQLLCANCNWIKRVENREYEHAA